MKVVDFNRFRSGLLVTRSNHWNKELCVKSNKRREIGIMVDKRFYANKLNGTSCYPVIHWEGGSVGSTTHPANAVPFRKSDLKRATYVEIEE